MAVVGACWPAAVERALAAPSPLVGPDPASFDTSSLVRLSISPVHGPAVAVPAPKASSATRFTWAAVDQFDWRKVMRRRRTPAFERWRERRPHECSFKRRPCKRRPSRINEQRLPAEPGPEDLELVSLKSHSQKELARLLFRAAALHRH